MPMTEVLLCPDKFKDCLAAADVASALRSGIHSVLPQVGVDSFAVSDGGDGLLEAVSAHGFTITEIVTHGPTSQLQRSRIALCGTTAVIELAEIVGARRLPDGIAAPLTASTSGLGEAIMAALDTGCIEIVIGLGGSASTDGGAGMIEALGGRLIAHDGSVVAPGGAELARLSVLDLSGLDSRLSSTRFTVACDVQNPLLGDEGAARVFGPQKGANARDIEVLEEGLVAWHAAVLAATGRNTADTTGAGAAGGTGYAAVAILNATARSGIELVLQLGNFGVRCASAALVIVGEGSLDRQSLGGKAPIGVAAAATNAGAEVVAVCGINTLTGEQLRASAISKVYSLADVQPDRDRSIEDAAALLHYIGQTIASRHIANNRSGHDNREARR